MALSTDVRKLIFTGDGGTSAFPITYRFFTIYHLVARVTDLLGNVTNLVPGVDFTLSGDGMNVTGVVHLAGGNLTNGYTLSIERTVPYVQLTDLVNEGAFYPQTIEDTHDYAMMCIQQLVAGWVYLNDIVIYGWNLIYDLAAYVPETMGASEVVARWAVARTVSFPAGMTGSRASSGVAATASTVIEVKKNGTQVATITFGVGGTTGSYAAAVPWGVVAGDVVTLVSPASPDATLAQVSVTLAGARSP